MSLTSAPSQIASQNDAIDAEGKARPKLSTLLLDIKGKQVAAANARSAKEAQWRKNLMQFRGQDTEVFRESEHSKVSMRTTTVKVKAAKAQIVEALLSNGKFPLSIKETPMPEGAYEFAHIHEGGQQPEQEQPAPVQRQQYVSQFGFEGDGADIKPGASFAMMGGMFKNLQSEQVEQANVVDGAGLSGEPTVAPAKEAAKRMEKAIMDQLESSRVTAHLNNAALEACILGTGAFKGPFNSYKTVPYWEKQPDGKRQYKPKQILIPEVSFTSVWDLYIDPACSTDIRDAEWVIERHKMNMVEVLGLKQRPLFKKEAIDALIAAGPNYSAMSGTDSDREDPQLNTSNARMSTLWEVWEYWGYMQTSKLKEFGLKVPEEAGDYVQVNVWYSGDYVLRVTLNPFQPARIPYYVFPYERDPYSIYGTGVPDAMADQQKLMNGFLRMAVDNLALAGNLVFDVDETSLVPGQPMEIAPGQIFRRTAGSAGQSIYGIKFPSTANENLQMLQAVRQHADESTGIPSLAHGQTGVSGSGRTAAGMSMILNNASLNIKSAVRNIDEHLIVPLGHALFSWNMQFNSEKHPEIEGDLEIIATGASNLEMKDVEAQRLQTFLQLSANPALAPLIRLPVIVKRLAQVMDMDPEDILNTPEEAQFYAQLMGQQGMQQTASPGNVPSPMMGQQGNDAGAGNQTGFNGNVEGVNAPTGAM
jgi:hypothetical protein